MFRAGIEAHLTFRLRDILPLSYFDDLRQLGNLTHYVKAFVCLHFTLSDSGVLNSLEELCITRVATVDSFARVLNPREGSVYIFIHKQTV